eukprot:GABV01000094.1.p1 GENE.GABV01000094.1~~GABV01000094.1.p1  ORF type:complete len:250 (+),score=59.87 GABV01000094.1:1-750(+)
MSVALSTGQNEAPDLESVASSPNFSKFHTWDPNAEVELQINPESNLPDAEAPLTMYNLLAKAAETQTDRPALAQPNQAVDDWNFVTFNEYLDQSRQVSKSLMALNVPRFGSIAILGFNSIEWFVALFGSTSIGIKATGVYPTQSPPQLQYILEHSQSSVLFVDTHKQLNKLDQIRDQIPSLKHVVVWRDSVPDNTEAWENLNVISWKQFLELQQNVSDQDLDERIAGTRRGIVRRSFTLQERQDHPKAS